MQVSVVLGQINPYLKKDKVPAFKEGEVLKYYASYSNKVMSFNVADAELTVESDTIDGHNCYKIIASAVTRQFFNLFFCVNDVYTSYIDSKNFKAYRAMSCQREGGYRYETDFKFNWNKKTVFTYGHNIKRDRKYTKTMNIGPFSFDGLSLFYNLRNADFSQAKNPGDIFEVSLVLEDTVRTMKLKYLGKEKRQASKTLGVFNTLKFSCVFATSSDESFKDGDEFFVWISDDKNKIPVYVESPLQVGKVYVTLNEYSNLANDLTSKL